MADVQRSVSQPISGKTIGIARIGYDLAKGGDLTSDGGITAVSVGHTLAGNITAKGGDIQFVGAGIVPANDGSVYGAFGPSSDGLSQASIQGATIKATGDIDWISAMAGPGYGGDITGATISGANLNTIIASGNLDAKITAGGSIGMLASGEYIGTRFPGTGVNGGDLTGSISAGTSIRSITALGSPFNLAVGSEKSTITAGTDIQYLTATLDIGGSVTAGHSLVTGVSAGRDITGNLTATSGDIGVTGPIGGVLAGRDVTGNLTAGGTIGFVTAGRNIDGDIKTGGNLGNVTSGTGPAGGDIGGNITAGGSIGNIFAGGTSDEKDISTWDTPAGLIGTGLEWWLDIDMADDTYTVDKPDGAPAPDGGGSITGQITAGSTLGSVTAYGAIDQAISAVQSIGSIWALGDIDGAVTAGTGSLLVNSWGSINGALTAVANITTSAFMDITGDIIAGAGLVANTWGSFKSAVEAKYNVAIWSLSNIASSSIVSQYGQLAFTAFGTIQDVAGMGANMFVHFAGNIEDCTFTSDATGLFSGASFAPGPAIFYVWGNITGTTIDVAHLAGTGAANPLGYVSIIAGGNVTGTTVKASIGVDVLTNGSATDDTIDTMAGAALADLLRSAANGANNIATLGGLAPAWTLLVFPDITRLAALGFGALLNSFADAIGYVTVMAEKGANATINSPSSIQVASLNVAGTYTANEVDIDAWNGASLGNVEGHNDVNIFVHGTLSGTIDSDNGTIEIETSGDVTATTTGLWSVALKTQGGCTGGSVTSANGPVAIDAYGDVSCPVKGKAYVDITSDTGNVSGQIDTAGYAKVAAGGGSSSNINAGGNVVIASLGNVSGTIAAGDGSYVPNDGDPANIQQTWSADIDAEGNAGGTITAPGEISVEANGNISSQVTSQYSTVELDAAGQVSSSEVQGAGDVTLLGPQGINAGTVTSQNGALYARSGNELILSSGSAATTATVIAAGEATATVAMSNSAGTVTVTGLDSVTATVNGACAAASISAGGDATVNVQGTDGGAGPGTVNVVAIGAVSGSIGDTGAVNVTGWGGVNVTANATTMLAVVSGGGLQGTYTSGGSLSVEAQGAVSGTYSAEDGGVSVVGKTSVDGQVSDTTSGSATVASLGNVGASVTTTGGDIGVNSGAGVTGTINSGHDANVSSLGGAVSGTVTAANNASLLASQGVTQTVEAGQNVSIVAFGNVSNTITATAGSATLDVYGTLSGAVSAGTTASVYADQAQGGITAGGDANVTSKNTIASVVTAGGNANVSSVQGVQGEIQATGSATVLAIQDVSGDVTTNGGVTISCGGALSSIVQAGGDANIVSIGDISGDITANNNATVTGWSGIDSDVNAKTGSATLYVNGDLNGATNAGAAATATVTGDVVGDITAGGGVTVDVGGEQEGQIDAGGDVAVNSGGLCSGAINTTGGVDVESLGDITSEVIAGGNISLDTWANIDSDKVQAGGSASLDACGNLQATVTAATGTIDIETLGTTQATATAQGDVTLDSLGTVSQTSLTSNTGGVYVDVSDNATITIQAAQDASILVTGALDGTVTTTTGDIDAESLGTLTGTYTAGGDAEVDALDDVSTATISAAGNADLTGFAGATGVSVSGVLSASAWAGDAFSGSVTSTQGNVDVSAIGDMTVTVNAGGDATVEGLGNVQANITSGGDSFVAALGNLSGPVQATGNAGLFAGGTLDADITGAYDATLEAIGDLTGTAAPSHDLSAASYGNLNPTNFQAGQDVTLLWARGDITGTTSAAGSIDQVEGYGSINASLTAPNIGTVEAFGPIGGTFTASTAIGSVASGGAITAALDSPSIGSIAPYQHGLLTDWPQAPVISDALEIELRDEDRAALENLAAQLAAEKAAALAQLPADIAAATPTYQVSIGDLAAAVAWFQSEAIQLAAQIATMQAADQQSLTAAQTSLRTFFAAEDARLALAKSGNQSFFQSLGTWLAQVVADRESDAAADEAVAQIILAAAQKEHTDILAKLDYQRDEVWPIMFEKQLLTMMLDRLQLVLDIVGILDPTPISDGVNGLISAARGNLMDAGISAVSMIPYCGDLAKLLKVGKLGKFADDGLAAMRRVAGDFLNLAAKGAGYANSCQAAAALGARGRWLGKLDIIGCFDAETQIVMADIDREIARSVTGVESALLDEPAENRWLWMTLIVGTGIAINRLANRAQREKAKRDGVVDCVFANDETPSGRDDCVDELAAARHRRATHARDYFDLVLSDLAQVNCALVESVVPTPANTRVRKYENSRLVRYDVSQFHGEFAMKTLAPPRISHANHCATTKPPRSRFGFIALLSALVVAAWVGFRPSSARPRPVDGPLAFSGYVGSTTVPTSATVSRVPRTKRIADVVVGDRVKADNPTGEEDLSLGAEVDSASWRNLVLRASKKDGSWADVELLRPLSWIEERGARVGGTAPISVPECGIDGNADVLAIEPCPPIMPGRGRVVTGTFHHSSAHVMELHVDGLDDPIITTINHLFWSADRQAYIRADALSRGERLNGQSGFMAVAAVVPLDRAIPVYNLEVHGAHVYHVSAAGILVHNSATTDDCVRLAYRDPIRPPYNNGATHIDHAQARSLGGSNAPSNLRPLPAETNLRKGGHEGAIKAYREYLIRNGMLREDAEKVIQAEIEALMKSPPPRPIDPSILDQLPTNPLDQAYPY